MVGAARASRGRGARENPGAQTLGLAGKGDCAAGNGGWQKKAADNAQIEKQLFVLWIHQCNIENMAGCPDKDS